MEDPERGVYAVPPVLAAVERRAVDAIALPVAHARQAVEVMCGLASELQVYPRFERLPGIVPFHSRGLLPLSYHIADAMGALHMLHAGVVRPSVWVLLTACLESAEQTLREMEAPLGEMRAASERTTAFEQVAAVERWARHCATLVRRAGEALRAVTGADYARLESEAREYSRRIYTVHREQQGVADPSESAS